jgi:hypothetical protein
MNNEESTLAAREPIVLILCSVCGQSLSVYAKYNSNNSRISFTPSPWAHDERGVYCPRCAPDVLSGLPDDDDYVPGDEKNIIRDPAGREKKIIDALRENPGGLTVAALAEMIGIPRTTAIRRFEALLRRSEIEKKNGRYFLQSLTQAGQNL